MVHSFGDRVAFVVENYGSSELAKRFGVTRYPAIFVDDILVAKPKDFGFYGKGEGEDEGRYTPWKDSASHEKFRADLKRMLDLVLAGGKDALRREKDSEAVPEVLASLPDLTLKDLTGAPVKKEDLAGKAVLVEFWATWCPPCRGTLAWLGQLKKNYGDRIVILAVAMESDEPEVRKVVDSLKIPIRWAMGDPSLARSFGDISAVPTLYLFDGSGKTVEIFYGAPPELHASAEKAIHSVLQ